MEKRCDWQLCIGTKECDKQLIQHDCISMVVEQLLQDPPDENMQKIGINILANLLVSGKPFLLIIIFYLFIIIHFILFYFVHLDIYFILKLLFRTSQRIFPKRLVGLRDCTSG